MKIFQKMKKKIKQFARLIFEALWGDILMLCCAVIFFGFLLFFKFLRNYFHLFPREGTFFFVLTVIFSAFMTGVFVFWYVKKSMDSEK